MRVAESILFAGKAIRVLRNPSRAFLFQDAEYNQQMPKGSQKLQGFLGRFPFQKEPFADKEKIGEELLPQSEADKIEAMLSDLKVSLHYLRLNFFVFPFFDIGSWMPLTASVNIAFKDIIYFSYSTSS